MANLFDLTGKTAIVTGAGRGIGRSIALGIADAGCDVALVSRTESELIELAEEIEKRGRRALVAPCDVTKPTDIERAVEATKQKFGKIDILINNAGITIKKPAELYELEDWNRVIAVNLTGVFLFAQYTGREMIKQRSGKIINISSIAAKTAITGSVAYCASKGGVDMITKVLACEWAPYGITVNAIGPAYIETPLVAQVKQTRADFEERVVQRTPLRRLGQPDEIVGAAIFLSSDASSYMTGETIFVDGGWRALGM
jgi:NAD(P)-dependent dehydrogenase (short-subunit alcohol dehydrogenase family)